MESQGDWERRGEAGTLGVRSFQSEAVPWSARLSELPVPRW